MAKYGITNPIFKPARCAALRGVSDLRGNLRRREGKQYYLDVHVAYRQACLNAIEYLTNFGYSGEQAYAILGTAPVRGTSPASSIFRTPARRCGFRPRSSTSTSCRRRPDRSSMCKAGSRCRCRPTSDPPRAVRMRCGRKPCGIPGVLSAHYEYMCADSGPFTQMRPMAESDLARVPALRRRSAARLSHRTVFFRPVGRTALAPTAQRAQRPRAASLSSQSHGAGCSCCSGGSGLSRKKHGARTAPKASRPVGPG